MNDFFEFDERKHQKQHNGWKFVVVAIVFLLIGSISSYYLVTWINENTLENKTASTNLDSQIIETTPTPEPTPEIVEEEEEKIEETEEETEEEKSDRFPLPQLGARGDVFITSNNPVVEIAEKVGPAIVGITKRSTNTVTNVFGEQFEVSGEGYGSGIVISSEGYIVTNNHVVENADELVVILKGGQEVKAQLIGTDATTDIAVIKIEESDLTVAILGDSSQVKTGEMAVAIGNPLGHELAGTVTVGIISAVDRSIQVDGNTMQLLQTDAAINPGNSGGALVNANGEVIGMNTLKTIGDDTEGLGFAIPSNEFKEIALELIENGTIERPALGVQVGVITAEILETSDIVPKEFEGKLFVAAVNEESAAANAGLARGDILLTFDEVDIDSFDTLKSIINEHQVGDVVQIKIWRNGEEILKEVTLQLQVAW